MRISKLQAILLIWVLGALSFCMLIRPQIRFGASFYAFSASAFCSLPVHAALAEIYETGADPDLVVCDSYSGLAISWHAIGTYSTQNGGEKALFTELKSLPQDGRSVFVVNAPAMLSAPTFIAKAWNLNLNIVFLDQVRGCKRAGRNDARDELSYRSVSVEIPSCAAYVLSGVPENIQSKAVTGSLLRPGIGMYRFPSSPKDGRRLSTGDIDFGRALQIQFTHSPGTILAYDWQKGIYRTLVSGTQ